MEAGSAVLLIVFVTVANGAILFALSLLALERWYQFFIGGLVWIAFRAIFAFRLCARDEGSKGVKVAMLTLPHGWLISVVLLVIYILGAQLLGVQVK